MTFITATATAATTIKCNCFRRQVKKSKSVIHLLLFNEEAEDDVKCKNIKQTEILVDLREAILQVCFTYAYEYKFTIHSLMGFLFLLYY